MLFLVGDAKSCEIELEKKGEKKRRDVEEEEVKKRGHISVWQREEGIQRDFGGSGGGCRGGDDGGGEGQNLHFFSKERGRRREKKKAESVVTVRLPKVRKSYPARVLCQGFHSNIFIGVVAAAAAAVSYCKPHLIKKIPSLSFFISQLVRCPECPLQSRHFPPLPPRNVAISFTAVAKA